MIVCHCQVVSDRDVARAVDAGAHSVSAVCRSTGAGKDCGACVFTLKTLVCEHHRNTESTLVEVEGAAS